MITYIKMIVMSSSKRIQTLLGHFYAVLFAIIVFKKYPPTYLSSLSRGGQLKTGFKLILTSKKKRVAEKALLTFGGVSSDSE
jgi:hypothetical protein